MITLRHTATTVRSALALAHPAGRTSPASMPPASRTGPDGSPDPGGEAGMATAEYAIGTLAAAAVAGLLLAIMRSGGLRATLQSIIESALSVG